MDQRAIDNVRIIGANNLLNILTQIDAAYTVNGDMRRQTGVTITMTHGTIHCKSNKQKLKIKSSTEVELVGTSNCAPYSMW